MRMTMPSSSTRRTTAWRSAMRYASMPTAPACQVAAMGLRLPAVVNQRPDAPVVQVTDGRLLLGGHGRQRGGRGVGPGLIDVARARDHRRDARLVDHPAQREL